MTALKEHLADHRRHVLGCLIAVAVLVTGIVLEVAAIAIAGGLACAAMCLAMVHMLFAAGRTH